MFLVDGNFDDQYLEEFALGEVLKPGSTVNSVASGDEAVAYMIGEGKFSNRAKFPFPTLIITCLNMARGDGLDVLEFLRHNTAWSVVPGWF